LKFNRNPTDETYCKLALAFTFEPQRNGNDA